MPAFPFTVVEHPLLSPTECLTCKTHACDEGFIDTGVEVFPYGRVYFCARCAWQAAGLVGCNDPGQVADDTTAIRQLEFELAATVAELEHERTNKVVSIDDVRVLIENGGSTTSSGTSKVTTNVN